MVVVVEPRGGAVGARAHPHVDVRRDEFARDFGPERGPTVGIPEEFGRGRRGDLRAALRVHRRGRRGQVARLIAASEALDEVPEPLSSRTCQLRTRRSPSSVSRP